MFATEIDQYEAPVTLADAHSQWHAIHGRFVVCPLDCGIGENLIDELQSDEDEVWGVRCGFCKGRHASSAGVRVCAEDYYAAKAGA